MHRVFVLSGGEGGLYFSRQKRCRDGKGQLHGVLGANLALPDRCQRETRELRLKRKIGGILLAGIAHSDVPQAFV
jgi:hypothetical protein